MSEAITVLGAGNGGCAAAADLTLGGWEVTLYNRTDARLEPFRQLGGVAFKDPESRGVVPIHRLTSDLQVALKASHRIVLMVPTSTLGYYAEAMAPSLSPEHSVLIAPGHTGGAMFFARAVASVRGDYPGKLAEIHTLPYICRMTGEGEVTLWKRANRLLFAALPAQDTTEMLNLFRSAFDTLVPVSSVLETSLSNLNAVMHPGAMILNAGWIEHTDGDFRFYSEGTTPAIGHVIAATDAERLAIGARLGFSLVSFIDAFYASGYTSEDAWRSGDTYRAIKESGPNELIRSPASLQHRYIHEDIGYGLVSMMAFAAAAEVDVPTLTALVHLASVATADDILGNGLTAARLGIEGMDVQALRRFALEGSAS